MMNNIYAGDDLLDWDYNYINSPATCPFCHNRSADCIHVLCNIDKNANVCLSGYLNYLNMTDHLYQKISQVIWEGQRRYYPPMLCRMYGKPKWTALIW